jgi:SAM-dependent methyltransferase
MLPDIPARSVSYAFSFDTFVHFDQPLFDAYLSEIARVLKPGGVFHLHYAQRLTESQSEEFRYREPGELFELTTRLGFTTGKRWFRGDGWGSVMVELTKAHPPHQPLA